MTITANQIKRAGRAFGWGAAGELIGRLIALWVPDNAIDDALISHGVAGIAGILGLVNWSALFPTRHDTYNEIQVRTRRDLLAADELFRDGLITQAEHMKMRDAVLTRNKAELGTTQMS